MPSEARRTEESALLRVEGLSLRLQDNAANIVDDVSFSIAAGETLCIVGESGCGKSVTALALMGLLPRPPIEVTGGRALFEGRDLLQLPAREMGGIRGDRISMIFQEPMTSLNPVFRIGDQVAEVVLRHRDVTRAEARARALEMFERVKIPAAAQRLDNYPHELSGGMRQRVMIAMALANDPQLLIADEPTTALDVTIQAQILDLIRDLQRDSGTALMLITHDLGVVAEMADRVQVLYAGRAVESATAEALVDGPEHPYTVGLLGSMPSMSARADALTPIEGSIPDLRALPPGCHFHPRCPFAAPRCRAERPPLAEVRPGHDTACWFSPLLETLGESAGGEGP